MSGLEKIIDDIRQNAAEAADRILSEAQQEAEETLNKAKAEADSISRAGSQKSDREVKQIRERAEAAAALLKQQKILEAKQSLIADTIAQAKQKVLDLPDDAYFASMKKLILANALPKAGVLYFSERDRRRLPAGFAGEINQALAEKGGALTISDETRKLEGGFVLAYGGIEENCSLDAMFAARHEELQDMVSKRLFADGQ